MKKNKSSKIQTAKSGKISTEMIHFYVLATFSILILPVIYVKNALDPSLMIRLFALNIFLLGVSVYIFLNPRDNSNGFAVLRHWIYPIFLAYCLITFISMFFAVNIKESYFDISKTFSIFMLTALAAVIFVTTPGWHNRLPKFVIFAALINCSVGYVQYYNNIIFGTIEFLSNGDPAIYLVKGLMSHKNVYAISLMLMLTFTGYGIYKYRNGWQYLSIITSLLILIMIFLLRTRSVWVGFAASLSVSVVLLVVFDKQFNLQKLWRIILLTGIVVFLTTVALILLTGKSYSDNVYINQLKTIVNPGASNNMFRLKIWELSSKMVADHPFTGVGAGNWKLVSPNYYDGYNFKKEQLNWVRPHNDYIWVITEKGIIGFLLFIGMFGITFFYMFKIFFSKTPVEYKVFLLFMMAGLISYLTDSLFSFPIERIEIQTFLALILAASVAIYHSQNPKKPFKISKSPVFIPVIILLLLSVAYSYSSFELELKVKRARIAQSRSDWKGMLNEAQSINTTFRTLDAEGMPVDWYYALAYVNLKDTEKAKDHYIKAYHENPTKIPIMNNLGQLYFNQENYNEAKDWFMKALAILPDYFEANVNLSATYSKLGEYENALSTLNNIPEQMRDERILKSINSLEKKISQQNKK